ncbi:MAG: efflux RND transporter periplasmic adaptor subunit [Proteobacteria bacterium]|nr:efflux RND transporter periplasmic adaptor subunit [Pseudomonadota bacterium]
MKHKKIIVIVGIIALIATGAFAATGLHSREQNQEPASQNVQNTDLEKVHVAEIKPVNVVTERAAADRLTEYVMATGVTDAKTSVTFSAEMPGRIEYLGADLGQPVKKGQVLARIDSKTLSAQKDHAEISYNLAKTTHGRLKELGQDIVSRQKIDESLSAMTGAEAQLEIARNNLKKGVLRSSLKGMISVKYVDKAEYVSPGKPMFTVVDYSTIIVEARLAETQIAMIETGSEVSVMINALGERFIGIVDTILPVADPSSKTFTVRVKMDNPELKVLVGMSASLKIDAKVHEDVVIVPQDVVLEEKNSRSVFVAIDGTAQKRSVRLGPVDRDRVVILEGIEAGDDLIVLGHRDLIDGQPINANR